jgi:hypothetical protein
VGAAGAAGVVGVAGAAGAAAADAAGAAGATRVVVGAAAGEAAGAAVGATAAGVAVAGATAASGETVEPAGPGPTDARNVGADAQFHAGEQTMGEGGSSEGETSKPGISKSCQRINIPPPSRHAFEYTRPQFFRTVKIDIAFFAYFVDMMPHLRTIQV